MSNPVVIVPGYYGSKLSLTSGGHLVWLDGAGLIHPVATLEALRLDPDDPDRVRASGILDEVAILPPFIDPNVYKDLIRFLQDNLHLDPTLVHPFYYDWRKSLTTAADELAEQIDRWLHETSTQQVDVIAHSFGGLVVRAYLQRHGTARVALFITCGAPHKGMLKTFQALTDGIRVLTFPAGGVKSVSRGFPSAYELLPTDPDDGLFTADGDSASPFVRDGWCAPEMKTFLSGAAQTLAAIPADTGVPTCTIYGTRLTTTTTADAVGESVSFSETDDGDGTVPRVSGRGDGVTGSVTRRFPVPFGIHMSLFANPYVTQRLLTPLLLRRPLPAHLLAARFRQEPVVVARSRNLLVVEVCDDRGHPVVADVRLDVPGTSVKNRPVPRHPHRLDYVLPVTMPGPGQHRRYTVVATIPGVADPLRHEGLLVAA